MQGHGVSSETQKKMLASAACKARVRTERAIDLLTEACALFDEANNHGAAYDLADLTQEVRQFLVDDIDPLDDSFDGLTVCPVCATDLQQIDQNEAGIWSGVCWKCDEVYRWDDEGFWTESDVYDPSRVEGSHFNNEA